jgi:hypothetical protein
MGNSGRFRGDMSVRCSVHAPGSFIDALPCTVGVMDV